jgi:hypothetical protein
VIPGTGVRGWLRSIYDKLVVGLTVSGSVSVSNLPATQAVSGSVSVSNFPPTQAVSAAALPLPTGAATETGLGTDGATPPATAGTGIRGWLRAIYEKSSSVFHLAAAASTNAISVKGSAGTLTGYAVTNTNAAIRYICFHNVAGVPTAGAGVFIKFGIPGGGAANVSFSTPISFNAGIGITTVVNPLDSDATAVAANDLVINLFYM